MTDRQYEETIINILCEVLEVNKDLFNNIKKNDPLGSLGLNSLKAIQVIVKLEDTYGISFEDEDLFFDKIKNGKYLLSILSLKLFQRTSSAPLMVGIYSCKRFITNSEFIRYVKIYPKGTNLIYIEEGK